MKVILRMTYCVAAQVHKSRYDTKCVVAIARAFGIDQNVDFHRGDVVASGIVDEVAEGYCCKIVHLLESRGSFEGVRIVVDESVSANDESVESVEVC